MADVVLSEDASRDLDAIYDYTVERWGLDQADTFLGQFDALFALLAETPIVGTRRPDLAGDLRSTTCGSHIVYFSIARDRVTIARVLHGRMAPKNHL